MKKQKINVAEYKNETQSFAKELCEKAITRARDHGRSTFDSGLPSIKGDKLQTYISPIQSWFEGISAEVNSKINSAEQMMVGSFRKGSYQDQNSHFQETSRLLTQNLKNLNNDYNQVHSPEGWKYHAYTAGILLIALGESIVSVNAIKAASSTLFSKLFLFGALLVTYLGISKLLLKWILYAQNLPKMKRRLGHFGVFSLLFTGFYLLGSMRIAGLNATAIGAEEVYTSPMTFACVNMLFMAGSVTLHYFREAYKTDPEDERKKREFRTQKKKLTKELDSNEKEFAQFKRDYPEDQAGRIALLSIINPIHDLIKAKYKEAVETFKTEIISRSQGQRPDCLDQPIPPLNVADYFSHQEFQNQD